MFSKLTTFVLGKHLLHEHLLGIISRVFNIDIKSNRKWFRKVNLVLGEAKQSRQGHSSQILMKSDIAATTEGHTIKRVAKCHRAYKHKPLIKTRDSIQQEKKALCRSKSFEHTFKSPFSYTG